MPRVARSKGGSLWSRAGALALVAATVLFCLYYWRHANTPHCDHADGRDVVIEARTVARPAAEPPHPQPLADGRIAGVTVVKENYLLPEPGQIQCDPGSYLRFVLVNQNADEPVELGYSGAWQNAGEDTVVPPLGFREFIVWVDRTEGIIFVR